MRRENRTNPKHRRITREEQNFARRGKGDLDGAVSKCMLVSSTESPYLTNSQDVIDVKALEEWPHRKVDVNKSTPKVESTRETGDDLQVGVTAVGLGASVKLYEFTRPRSGVCENFRYLQGMRLDILGETSPR